MTTNVVLSTKGHINLDELQEFIEGLGEANPRLVLASNILRDTRYFQIELQNPYQPDQKETLRIFHSYNSDCRSGDLTDYLGDGEYTQMKLSLGDHAEQLMEDIAREFGGYLVNEASPENAYIIEKQAQLRMC